MARSGFISSTSIRNHLAIDKVHKEKMPAGNLKARPAKIRKQVNIIACRLKVINPCPGIVIFFAYIPDIFKTAIT